MSAQNNFKKPVFTKSVMGYTPREVDQYIEYMNEQYAAATRDIAELRRRLTRYQLGLDPVEKQPAAEDASGFTDAALDKLRHMISAERSRHEEALDALLSFIETYKDGREVREKVVMDMSDDGFVPLDDESDTESEESDLPVLSEEDAEWEQALESFIADADEDEPSEADEIAEDDVDYAVAEDIFGACEPENPTVENTVEESVPAEVAEVSETPETEKKTRAQLALELDFYSDAVVRDGESYDPMTLARNASMQRKRPSLEDFMNPLDEGEKPKRR